ncbi:type VII secretion system (Wss) protein ESAT-6 [Mycobacterium sp. BK086]|uniref:CHAP domain-containing protein n=1 Tax=Mycobacterium sp. BK086 TaxID=2512165 RepID=UPI00105F7F74|nr:CHAP domain-containing protein [Mycobacterium sp. BK086]TDO10465.1 type VII secretion system (Wss) protein ESAT-6 [Mycobacterium sp. BK086]
MARMGMDVDQVEQTGRQLKSHATAIGTLVAQLDKVVNALPAVWQGPDAQRFVTEWWPQHRQSLTTAQSHIDGLGQSALNNASEQRSVSADGSASGSTAPTAGATTSTVASAQSAAATSAMSSANSAAAAGFVSQWQGKFIDPDHSYGAQCFDVFRQYSNQVVGANGSIATDSMAASDIYNHYDSNGVSQYYDRIAYGQGQPQAGDIIVYGNGQYGHVALVTGVDGNNYSVLEQNYSQDGIDANDPAAVHSYAFSDKAVGPILGYLRPKNVNV